MHEEVMFKPGDVVCLKSGSGRFTVTSVNSYPNGELYCTVIWSPYPTHTLETGVIPVSALRKWQ